MRLRCGDVTEPTVAGDRGFESGSGFPDLAHDDEVDAGSGALEMLNPQMKGWGIFELYRRQAEQLLGERKARGETT